MGAQDKKNVRRVEEDLGEGVNGNARVAVMLARKVQDRVELQVEAGVSNCGSAVRWVASGTVKLKL